MVETNDNRGAGLFPMRLLGFGLYLAWVTTVASFEQWCGVADLSSPVARLFFSSALTAVGYCALARLARGGRSLWSMRAVIACGMCALVSPALIYLASATGVLAVDVCALVLKSCATVCFFLMWNALLVRHQPRTAWVAYAGSMVVAACVCLLCSLVDPLVQAVLVFALPIASCALLVLGARLPGDADEGFSGEPVKWHFPWRPVVLVVAFSFVQNMVGHYDGSVLNAYEWGRLVAAGLILAGLLAAFDRFDVSFVIKVSPVLIVAGLLLCGLPGFDGGAGLQKLLCSTGYDAFTLYMLFALHTLCYRYGIRAEWLFGPVQAASILAGPFGALLGNRLNALGAAGEYFAVDVAASVAVLAVVLVSLLLIGGHALDTAWGIRGVRLELQRGGVAPGSAGRTATSDYLRDHVRQCAAVSKHYGLTHREEEVLALLAEGKSFAEVEAALCIAHATLRSHVQHVYAKLGVHSAEEARAAVASWRP